MYNYRLAMTVLPCIVLCSLLAMSCSKDDSPTAPQNDMVLVGYWEVSLMRSIIEEDTTIQDQSTLDAMGLVWDFRIEDDMTIEQITNISGPLVTMPGTWGTSGNQLSLTLTGPSGGTSTLVYTYTVDDNLLTLDWQLPSGTKFYAEFTRQ